jgi:hypothetical protein
VSGHPVPRKNSELPWYKITAHCPSLVQDDCSLSFLGTDVVYVIMTGIFLNYMSFDGLGGSMS